MVDWTQTLFEDCICKWPNLVIGEKSNNAHLVMVYNYGSIAPSLDNFFCAQHIRQGCIQNLSQLWLTYAMEAGTNIITDTCLTIRYISS